MSLIVNTDSYKLTHHLQNPDGTTRKWSYIESRGAPFPETVFFGLQMFLDEYLTRPVTTAEANYAEEIVNAHLGRPIFNRSGWEAIIQDHGGFLPIEIEAIPEGTIMAPGNVQIQVSNTDPRFPWLSAYVETALLRAIWYPSTVATVSREIKKAIKAALDKSCDNPAQQLPFKLHDFGARGVSSLESAGIGGLAHLVNFKGSDTIEALEYGRRFYGEPMAAFSIPAAEHSTVTCWGKSREADFVGHMIRTFGGKDKLFAVVGDSYSIYNFTTSILGDDFRAAITASGGTLVARPDSGDPVQVPVDVIKLLLKQHGHSINGKGYAVLPSYIRVIQGDGINAESIQAILNKLLEDKISAENIAFGMGGALLQKVDRDTMRYAMKTSAAEINGEIVDVFKKPMTDPSKDSKRGILALIRTEAGFETIRQSDLGIRENVLRPIFRDGKVLRRTSLAEVRERARVN